MLRWFVALVAGSVLSIFAALLLDGRHRVEGEVLVALTDAHGIHRGDVLVAGGWVIGMIAVAVLLLDGPRR